MDPFSMVFGAAIALGGFVVGRVVTRRQAREAVAEQRKQEQARALNPGDRAPQPLCGCGHHLVFHDQQTKKCQTQVVIPGRWTGSQSSTYRQCMCQGYRGPVPLDEYYAPDYLGGEG
ncbi:hypothetical protein ABZ249_22775 [Nocardiopsis sp. NPDC006139]|uniref:Uncharacterized protein n=1 Tax=Nocardiopsis changdeensis TaxID=2831969 RepID=A0ABX8BRI7_9ACTN|nr:MULTISPECIES: hypothetical protein [Nocardiopsis]QUX24699.1 hypothetical protein KGD84_10780 [Nocardiopsis changdeensis]QYX35086.1 hypothetical protein K1J57_20225 [Nocardiopsis sp. MT53]